MSRWLKDFPHGSVVKNLSAAQELQKTQVRSLGWEDPLEDHSSIPVYDHSSIPVYDLLQEVIPVFLPGESHR